MNTKSTGDFRMLQNNINKKKLNVLCYINKTYIVLNLYIHTSMFDFINFKQDLFFLGSYRHARSKCQYNK